MLEQDRERLCGPAYSKQGRDGAVRWWHTDGRLVMGGHRVTVRKPRARKDDKEVTLPSWAQFADEDPLDERTLEQMMVGVSTRSYERSIEPLPDDLAPHGTSKSAVSRRFVTMTQQQVEQWLERDISTLQVAAVMIDGIEISGRSVVIALGIDQAGNKHVLGIWLGATESAAICNALLENLIERGLDAQRAYLFVIDGSKALRKAIRERFGPRGLVQRCQQHKRRNVCDHLPKRLHGSTMKTMRDAYRSSSRTAAKNRLLRLANQLQDDHPDAARSLREGLDETLTLKDMGLPEWLERTLSTTNPIENLNGTIRRLTRRVKHGRNGSMIKRWVAARLHEAQQRFHRIRGHKGLPKLIAVLYSTAEQPDRLDRLPKAA